MTEHIPGYQFAFIDRRVSEGADVAVRREQRRLAARRDAEIYAAEGPDAEAHALVVSVVAEPFDLD